MSPPPVDRESGDDGDDQRAARGANALRDEVQASWHRFLDVFEPLRPELYRYCRHLTRSPWDAEDLVQDALMRGFVTLGTMFRDLPNPRAWLFRVASNLWIDQLRLRQRRSRPAVAAEDVPADRGVAPDSPDPRAPREAAGSLLLRLSPQERAAVVLKDVFDFSLEEVAEILTTTAGAVKAALHRGRGKLSDPAEESPGRRPAPGVLDAFCAAFTAGDLERLTGLLLESATVEIVGLVTEYGADAPKDPRTGSFAGTLAPFTQDERGGVAPALLAGYLGGGPRCEARAHRGGWLVLFWYQHASGPAVRSVMTVEIEGDRIARARSYFFSPEVIAETCAELAVPCHGNGYRYWNPEP